MENRPRVKLLFATCPIVINSSCAVLFMIEKAENYCESVFTGAGSNLIGQVDESCEPLVQTIKLLELKLITSLNF